MRTATICFLRTFVYGERAGVALPTRLTRATEAQVQEFVDAADSQTEVNFAVGGVCTISDLEIKWDREVTLVQEHKDVTAFAWGLPA